MVRSARSVRTQQSGGSARHGQEHAQCCNAAVGWACSLKRARLRLSGAHAVLSRSSRAGVLTMVRRARSVVTKYSPWSGVLERSSQAGALLMVRRARSARAKQWCGRAMQGCRKKAHAVERGFWSASKNLVNVFAKYSTFQKLWQPLLVGFEAPPFTWAAEIARAPLRWCE